MSMITKEMPTLVGLLILVAPSVCLSVQYPSSVLPVRWWNSSGNLLPWHLFRELNSGSSDQIQELADFLKWFLASWKTLYSGLQ